MFGATRGFTADRPCVFGVPKLVWTEAAKVKGRIPWHAGVLKGVVRFMNSWHKDEEEASRQRAIKRGGNGPKNSLGTTPTNGTGGGRVKTAGESKQKGADCVARCMLQIEYECLIFYFFPSSRFAVALGLLLSLIHI